MNISYTLFRQDCVAGLFCEQPAPDILSFAKSVPSFPDLLPRTVLADLQARFGSGGTCFMRTGRPPSIPTPKIGDTFNKWVVEALLPLRYASCRCECGNTANVKIADLFYSRSTQCRPCVKFHGACKNGKTTPEYTAWQDMQRACSGSDPKRKEYRIYFLKGIKVSPQWVGPGGFQRFLSHVGNRPSPSHSLNRYPEKTGDFKPGNVRWATPREHGRSTSRNIQVTYQDITQSRSAWAEDLGLPRYIVGHRTARGWDIKRALAPVLRGPQDRCRSGHEYTAENTYISPQGARHCRACRRPYSKTRKAHIRIATPGWLSRQQQRDIRAIYLNCPRGYEVDHEIPLRGKNVCGLHVPWNLRPLSAAENQRKGNKTISQQPDIQALADSRINILNGKISIS